MRSSKNSYLIAGIITVGLIGGGIGVYTLNNPVKSPAPAANNPAPTQLAVAISDVADQKAVLIDVRTPGEYAAGHAKGAINVDSVEIESGKLPEVEKSAKIYLYCHSGRRAGIVLPILKQAGFTDVINLGAFDQWIRAGGPQA